MWLLALGIAIGGALGFLAGWLYFEVRHPGVCVCGDECRCEWREANP